MNTLILSLHVIVCILLVILVLLQAGKEGMGVIFGGGNSSVFGSAGAGGILAKLTAFMAILFVGTCLSYNLLTKSGSKQDSTILDVQLEDAANTPKAQQETPAASQPKPAPAAEPAVQKPASQKPVAQEPAKQARQTKPAGASSAPAAKEAPKAAAPSTANGKKQN